MYRSVVGAMVISGPYLDEIRARWEAVRDIAIEIASASMPMGTKGGCFAAARRCLAAGRGGGLRRAGSIADQWQEPKGQRDPPGWRVTGMVRLH